MLRSDLDAPKKQRHTARRVLARLVDQHGVAGSVVLDGARLCSPNVVRKSLAEAGKLLESGCVPQTHPPAAEGEVDFHDLWVVLRGVKTKTALFTMRLSFSGRAAHRASLPRRGRRRSWKATSTPSSGSGACRWTRSATTTSSQLVSGGCCAAVLARRPTGGSRSARTTASTLVLLRPRARRAVTRRAVWRARVTGSAATTASPMPVVDLIEELNELLETWGRRGRLVAASATVR